MPAIEGNVPMTASAPGKLEQYREARIEQNHRLAVLIERLELVVDRLTGPMPKHGEAVKGEEALGLLDAHHEIHGAAEMLINRGQDAMVVLEESI